MLKCLSICLRGRGGSTDACKICSALLLMLRHLCGCAAELCKLCDGIVLLCASEHQPSPSREQLKEDLRSQFAESSSSEDETASESDSGQSSDVVDSQNASAVVKSSDQAEGGVSINKQLDRDVVQGIYSESICSVFCC